MALYMLRNYFEAVPPSPEEAAKVDGAGRLRVTGQIVLPLALPSIVAAGTHPAGPESAPG